MTVYTTAVGTGSDQRHHTIYRCFCVVVVNFVDFIVTILTTYFLESILKAKV